MPTKIKILHYICLAIMLGIFMFSLVLLSDTAIKPGNSLYNLLCLIIAITSVSIMLLGDHIRDKMQSLTKPVHNSKPKIRLREPKCVGTGIHVHEQYRYREHELVPGDTYWDADYGAMIWTGKEWLSEDHIPNN
jgi:hypothetical protein